MVVIQGNWFALDLMDFMWIWPKRPHHKCHLVDLCVRKPYKNCTFGCKVEQKAYKTNALEHQLPKHDFSSKHFVLFFIGPDAVLQIHLINLSVGVKSFAHRTLLFFSSQKVTHKRELYL